MPEPTVAAWTSSHPPNTGVPSMSPVSAAASRVMPPTMSVLATSGGSRFISMPTRGKTDIQSFFFRSSP